MPKSKYKAPCLLQMASSQEMQKKSIHYSSLWSHFSDSTQQNFNDNISFFCVCWLVFSLWMAVLGLDFYFFLLFLTTMLWKAVCPEENTYGVKLLEINRGQEIHECHGLYSSSLGKWKTSANIRLASLLPGTHVRLFPAVDVCGFV